MLKTICVCATHKDGQEVLMCLTPTHRSHKWSAQGWNKIDTMWSAYIKPFVAVFPHSPVLAELFDWLRSC